MSREEALMVKADRVVGLRFTIEDETGQVLDEATDEAPFVYLHGHDQLLAVLEEALEGKEVGDRVSVTVEPEDGFGLAVEDGERTLPRDVLPKDAPLEPGTAFAVEDDGEPLPVWVVRATDSHVVVSLSHPLAGKTLAFRLDVVRVREASPEELARGRAHGLDLAPPEG